MSTSLRRAAALLIVLVVAWIGLVSGAGAASAEPSPPERCFVADSSGQLPECTWDGTRWTRSYPGDVMSSQGLSQGPGDGFAFLFVLVLLSGVALTVWKVSTARRMARDSGMSTGDATAMALLTDDGFESTYLASNLRGRTPAPAPAAPPPAADRLRELADLRDRGLITTEEHDSRRARILDAL